METDHIIVICTCSILVLVGIWLIIQDRTETPVSLLGTILIIVFGFAGIAVWSDALEPENTEVHTEGEVIPVDTIKKINSPDFIESYTLKYTDDSVFVFLGDKFVSGAKRIDIPSEH